MLIAGEASGDLLASELVPALREVLTEAPPVQTPDYQPLQAPLEPRWFGAGGPRMAAAGVELAFDLTAHSVLGISDVLTNYLKFRRLFHRLFALALQRQPDAIICVDFSGFNRRFAHAIKTYARARHDWFHDWTPKVIQYVSPQVWASREGRAYAMARAYDLVLSIFPFEPAWYAKRVPALRVEFVGNPLVDRFANRKPPPATAARASSPLVLLLPGSRPGELASHSPILGGALKILRESYPSLRARLVLPNEQLAQTLSASGFPADVEVRTGGLADSLQEADVALASTGTVTMECAFFGLPTVALYRTSWSNYQIAKQLVKVKYLAMPNLLANEELFPEFIQGAATPENIAGAALGLLRDDTRRQQIKQKLAQIVSSLGGPGANRRAAQAIARGLNSPWKR